MLLNSCLKHAVVVCFLGHFFRFGRRGDGESISNNENFTANFIVADRIFVAATDQFISLFGIFVPFSNCLRTLF